MGQSPVSRGVCSAPLLRPGHYNAGVPAALGANQAGHNVPTGRDSLLWRSSDFQRLPCRKTTRLMHG